MSADAGSSESSSVPPPAPTGRATRTDVRERPRTQSHEDPPSTDKGFGLAYAFVNKRERTEAEVRARLERGEVPSEEIETVIAELLEFGYLDDARYARVFTQDKRNLEAWGSERIVRALRERGIERDLIDAALAEEAGQEPFGEAGREGLDSELDRAIALLSQRFPAGPGAPRDRERAFGVLARKGYESETASDAVREWTRRTAL